MPDPLTLVKQFLREKRVMQLATTNGTELWSCNVHFWADDSLNLYWMSHKERLHSQYINVTHKASIAVMVHEDTPDEHYVIGVQLSGTAVELSDLDQVTKEKYFEKVKTAPALLADLAKSDSPLRFYKFTPRKLVLFDTKDFPEEPRLEIALPDPSA